MSNIHLDKTVFLCLLYIYTFPILMYLIRRGSSVKINSQGHIWEHICSLNKNQIHVINCILWCFIVAPWDYPESYGWFYVKIMLMRLIVARWVYPESYGWFLCQDNADKSHTVSHVYIKCQNIADTQA